MQLIKIAGRINYNREVNAQQIIVPLGMSRNLMGYTNQLSAYYIECNRKMDREVIKSKVQNLVGKDFVVKTNYEKNELIYKTNTTHKQLAVFSEVYYPKGWDAFIDDKPISYFKVNYLLRALEIPPGTHTIRFQFRPKVIQTGWWISMSAYLILFFFVLFQFKKALRV